MKLIVKNGALDGAASIVQGISKRSVIVTDSHLKPLGETLSRRLSNKGKISTRLLIIPAGEGSKNLETVARIAHDMLKMRLSRDACLIALGGGVVSDVAGFAASIYMRGIPLVVIPTTLLGMADSCIGGKTGVNLEEGKNLLGTFYDPAAVIIDPLLLKTLPDRQFRCGMAEIIKHAIIRDRAFFGFLSKNAQGILDRRPALLERMIKKSVQIKMKVVASDPRESVSAKKRRSARGQSRMLLNYGHTVGHALERISGYTMPHGEAISIGMVAENRVAVGKKILQLADALLIIEVLKRYGLPTKIPSTYSAADIKKAIQNDKKLVDGKIHFALPTKIGSAKILPL